MHRLKEKGYEISNQGMSVKTSKRMNREDYVDATQRYAAELLFVIYTLSCFALLSPHLMYSVANTKHLLLPFPHHPSTLLDRRGIIRAMGAASFGSNANGTPDVTSATSSTSSANLANLKSPPLEHRSSSSSSIKTTSSGQKISIFGKKKHD
ncbi:hypothetical protein FB446DRAFT_365971 [Lentinula raphanica]|nr:hypothetical protein FB446DRAFT_365971 [Lentinula raphanica]